MIADARVPLNVQKIIQLREGNFLGRFGRPIIFHNGFGGFVGFTGLVTGIAFDFAASDGAVLSYESQ